MFKKFNVFEYVSIFKLTIITIVEKINIPVHSKPE